MVATMQEIVDQSIRTVFNTDWFGTSILALILSAALSALAWMLSSAFQSNELKGWAKKELSEFIVSALILVLSVPLLMIITSMTIAYATAADPNLNYGNADPFSLAYTFVDKVERQLVSVYSEVSGTIIALTAISSFKVDLGAIAKLITVVLGIVTGGVASVASFFMKYSVTIGMGAPFAVINSFLSSIQSTMVVILLAFFVQKEILFFIQAAALPVLMPAGILLRAFPLTRRAGSTLIALALTLFIVYPLTLAFVGHMYDTTYNSIVSSATPSQQQQSGLKFLMERELPFTGDYYLEPNQEFRWLAHYNLSYSIWHDVPCSNDQYYSSQIMNNNVELPPDSYSYWKITQEETIWITDPMSGISTPKTFSVSKCYKKFKNGTVNAGVGFGFVGSEIYKDKDYENHTIIAVAKLKEDSNLVTNVEFFSFYLGNPCDKYPLLCSLGLIKGDVPINDIGYVSLATDAAVSGLKGITKTLAETGGRTISNIGLTPFAAGYVFYDITERLPIVVLPFLIALFSFVIILMISVSSFKAISTTLGGETKLVELGRLI